MRLHLLATACSYNLVSRMSSIQNSTEARAEMRVSNMAENLIGSEIIKLAGEIRDRMNKGEHIYNFTIGDFNPKIFPIPAELKTEIIKAYEEDETNYPAADGVAPSVCFRPRRWSRRRRALPKRSRR